MSNDQWHNWSILISIMWKSISVFQYMYYLHSFLFQVKSTILKLPTHNFSLPRVCPMILDPSCTIKLMHSHATDSQPSSQWIPVFLSTLLGSVMDFHEGTFSMSMHFIAVEVSISAIARTQLMPGHSMGIVSVLERTSANILQLKMIASHIG